MALIVMQRISIMFIIIIVGFICFRTKLVTKEGGKDLSNILMYIVNPLIILFAFQRAYSREALQSFLIAFALSMVAIGISIGAANLLIRKHSEDRPLEKYALVYTNCGFFGIPIVNSIYGMDGVFYLSAFIAAFNIFNWSHGISLMEGDNERRPLKEVLLHLVNPTTVMTIVGFILFMNNVKIPVNIGAGLQYIADMNTPLAMLIAGIALAQNSIHDIKNNKRLVKIIPLKLIIVPALTIIPLWFLSLPEEIKVIITIALACPSAASMNAFALQFNKNSSYSSQIFSITTIGSAITIPLFMLLYR